jgi:hypothetical protein
LEKDSTKLQTNYYTNGVGGHEAMIDLGFDASQDYHTYAIEWTPAFVKWFVDAQLVHTETGTRGPLPTTPGRIMFNLWTCTDTESGWCGKFVYPGEPIYAYFDRTCYTPYEFPALTATPTNTPVPTDTPTPTVIPNILIDDFENFSDWGLWYGNGAPCSPITQDTGYLGQSIKVSCTTHDTDDWWFVMKSINSDWASYAGVHLWYKETTGSGDMAVAIKDADGELWYASLQSSSVVWEQVFVPFSSFIIDPYDYHGNHNLDLNQVQEFRFRHLPQAITPVTLWVDELRVLQTAP